MVRENSDYRYSDVERALYRPIYVNQGYVIVFMESVYVFIIPLFLHETKTEEKVEVKAAPKAKPAEEKKYNKYDFYRIKCFTTRRYSARSTSDYR